MTGFVLSPAASAAVLSAYWAISVAIASALKGPRTKEHFLVAGRRLGLWESALSIAATWIWAPALFLAAQKAYTQGLAGLFWFTVPNVLCLVIFAWFADRLRGLAPRGFTLSAYMRQRYSRRVHLLYLLEMGGLAACSFAVQLLAGAKVLAFLTGLDFFGIALVLAAIALSYSLIGGLKSSVVTDLLQMFIILLVGGFSVVWILAQPEALEVLRRGLGGISGRFNHLFGSGGLDVAWAFGVPVTIGLLAGPFGDQSFYQRAFATRRNLVKKSFVTGALIFGAVPLMMSVFGFIAAGKGWTLADASLVNLEAASRLLPAWMVIPFVVMLLSGLISTLDSNLCAASALVGHDYFQQRDGTLRQQSRTLALSRLAMGLLAAVGLAVASIPGMQILYLFLFYGTLRASTLIPTVISLVRSRVDEAGMFYGILFSIGFGLPFFAYGNFTHQTAWTVAGSLTTVLISGIVVMLASLCRPAASVSLPN